MIKIIGCSVFKNKVEEILKNYSLNFDTQFINMENHLTPENLNRLIQKEITLTENMKKYEKIILLYGLCGNSTVNLSSTLPLIIPKVHDCCSIFLGSGKKFYEFFGTKLSAQWYTSDYLEEVKKIKKNNPNFQMSYSTLKLEDFIKKYGEDNGKYLYNLFSIEKPEVVFIKTSNKKDEKNILNLKKLYSDIEIIEGNFKLLIDLVMDNINEEILYLKPKEKITCTYDVNVIEGKF